MSLEQIDQLINILYNERIKEQREEIERLREENEIWRNRKVYFIRGMWSGYLLSHLPMEETFRKYIDALNKADHSPKLYYCQITDENKLDEFRHYNHENIALFEMFHRENIGLNQEDSHVGYLILSDT